MFEAILGVLLVLSTVCIRLVTAHGMKNQRNRVRRADGELREVARDLGMVMTAIQQAERQQRQYILRRSYLLSEMDVARAELAHLRRPASERLAA